MSRSWEKDYNVQDRGVLQDESWEPVSSRNNENDQTRDMEILAQILALRNSEINSLRPHS